MKNFRVACLCIMACASLLFPRCKESGRAVEGMGQVFQAGVCLSAFFEQNGRLPGDNAELEAYSDANRMGLDLSGIAKLSYSLGPDTSIVIEFELDPDSKGGFTINPRKPASE